VCVYSVCVCVSACVLHLAVLVLVGVRVHKDAEPGEEVHVSEHRACGKVQNVLEILGVHVASSSC